MGFPVQNERGHTVQLMCQVMCAATMSSTSLNVQHRYLIWIGSCHPDGVKKIFKTMRYRPEVESHLVGHQGVSVVKQVNITPS